MELRSHFSDFLHDIRPDDDQLREYQEGHRTLRERMRQDPEIDAIRIADFLQGSYRRATAIKPKDEQKSDVDVVVVTTLEETPNVEDIVTTFQTFLDRYEEYQGRHEPKTHSIGITLDQVELDLVITSAPSEVATAEVSDESVRTRDLLAKEFDPADFLTPWSETLNGLRKDDSGEWRAEPLRIPNFDDVSEDQRWGSTDPLTQIGWTVEHNAACDGHYVNVVKALKWWRRAKCQIPEHPKGYPVEHIIGDYCPAGIGSVAEGVVRTLEGIRDCPTLNAHLLIGTTPFLPDRGIREHNVWKRIEPADFATFMEQVREAATIAREAYDVDDADDSARRWHDLFGDPFPRPDDDDGARKSTFSFPTHPASPRHGRFG